MFSIFANEKVIGLTYFEYGDPPMGVAFGRLVPTANYFPFRASRAPDQVILGVGSVCWGKLTARTETGVVLDCEDVVLWCNDLNGLSELEVNALGIARQQYEEIFPKHVAAYKRRLNSSL